MTLLNISESLFPHWRPKAGGPPIWMIRAGLSKNKGLLLKAYTAVDHLRQAEADGIGQVAPIIVAYNKAPAEIREIVGGEAWRKIHHATLRTNTDRMVLMMLCGWTVDEALLFPAKARRRALTMVKMPKAALMIACRHAASGGSFEESLTLASDMVRMNRMPDPAWGRKRLKREHDARAVEMALASSDPTEWAKPWFCDVGAYSFSLLKSESELALEGALQRHCVRSYAKACREGREVVLRIEGKERATCSWHKKSDHIQVAGAFNRSVSPECEAAARMARANYEAHLKSAKGKPNV